MANKLPKSFDPDAPYGEVFGRPGVKFAQNGVHYNNHLEPVGSYDEVPERPKKAQTGRRPKQMTKTVNARGRPVVKTAIMETPDVHAHVHKENAAAASAEKWLE
jgi:hypothetical protein